MVEIRIHGRGGQGVVIASKVLAVAAAKEGKRVQSFPTFGAERRGAPVAAFTRIDERDVRLKCEIYHPDHVIVLDPVLHTIVDVTAGLKEGGWIVINSEAARESYGFSEKWNVGMVDGSSISLRHGLGTKTEPIVNMALLGAFSRVTDVIGIRALTEAIRESFPTHSKPNEMAAIEAYEAVKF
jgi:2-oxoacid:acceptor oxidoreductase gamma subunit (pyruvate/2-ketoisovalerate family)